MTKKDDPRIYLFQGKDDYSKDKALEELLDKLSPSEFRFFDMDEYSGGEVSASTILTGAGILPSGSPKRVVLVRFANKIAKEEQKELARNLYLVPESGCIVLSVPAPDMKDGRPVAGSALVAELTSAVSKYGKALTFDPVKNKRDIGAKVVPFVKKLFSDRNMEAEPRAVDMLINRVGTDFTLLNSEVDKLCAYCAAEKKIREEDVRECVSVTPEEKVFDFMDALLKKQGALALRLTEDLFTEGSDPRAASLRLLSLLAGQLRLLWQARIVLEKGTRTYGKPPAPESMGEYAGLFPAGSIFTKSQWQQNKLLDMAGKTGFALLARWICIAADTDAALKGIEDINEEPEDIIKMMVFNMVGQEAYIHDRRLG